MGKGNDPNCLASALPMDAAELAPEQQQPQLDTAPDKIEQAAASATRHPSRGKRGKKFTEAEKEEYRKKVDGYIEQLDQQVDMLSKKPELVAEWLGSMAHNRLWRYSYGNLMLARMQGRMRGFQDPVTRLASKSDWWKLGYKIRKGTDEQPNSGLDILAPKTVGIWVDKKDPVTGEPVLKKDGTPAKVKVGERIVGFKCVKVFDISQMEPVIDPETGQPKNKDLVSAKPVQAATAIQELKTAAEEQGIKVYTEPPGQPDRAYDALSASLAAEPNAYGFFTEMGKDEEGNPQRYVVLRPGLSDEEKARVLTHEVAHAILHNSKEEDRKDQTQEQRRQNKIRREVEAEGVAFVLSSFYGIEDKRQAAYVAHWAEGQETKALKSATGNIQRGVRKILEAVEKQRYEGQEA